MPYFSFIDYILIIFAAIIHYPYGKRLGIANFFTATLVGLSISGMAVGALANYCAGLIRPTIIIFILGGIILAVSDLRRAQWKIRLNKQSKNIYLILFAIGVIIFLFNNPAKVFLQHQGSNMDILFNRHYSYYSSQSTEMLNADYFSRLKISNLEPNEWSQYHFFNSGARSVTMGLIKTPGLFSYWIAQTILMIFVLLSFAEIFLFFYGTKIRSVLMLTAWFVIGFTFFSYSINWNFMTTGLFSVFAMVQLLISAHRKRWREVLLFSLILGASAFRLMPIAILLIVCSIGYLIRGVAYLNFKKYLIDGAAILRGQLAPRAIDAVMLTLFAFYNLVTIISAKDSTASDQITSFIAKGTFEHSWFFVLASYKFMGLIEFRIYKQSIAFFFFRNIGFFDKVMASHVRSALLIATLVVLLLIGFYYLIKIIFENKTFFARFLIPLFFIFIHLFFLPIDLVLFYEIVLPYLAISLLLIYLINKKHKDGSGEIKFIMLVLILGTIAINLSGIPFTAKGPATFITLDVALWAVLGIYLFTFAHKKPVLASTIILALIMMITLNFSLISLLRISDMDNHFYKMDITPLVSKNFNRSDYVLPNGFIKPKSDDPNTIDVYSSILGARVEYSTNSNKFLNNDFIKK